jgi:hypothetical protein
MKGLEFLSDDIMIMYEIDESDKPIMFYGKYTIINSSIKAYPESKT